MAWKTRIGKVSGDVQSLSLSITVWDDAFAEITYEDAFDEALNVAPATFVIGAVTLYPTGSPSIEDQAAHCIRFGITYEPPEIADATPAEPPETDTLVRRANGSTKGVKRYSFLAPVGVYDHEGTDVTASYQYSKWKIDLKTDDRDRRQAQGTTFEPLPETRTLDYYLANDNVNESYLNAVEALVANGCFNDDTFFGKPAGSVQIVRFSINQRSPDDWELSFGFGYKPPEIDLEIQTGMTIPLVRACDYLWTMDKEIHNATAKLVELYAELAYVGQVWPAADFSVLSLPGA